MRTALALAAAILTAGWGVAHLFPTRSIVRGFGDIGTENRRVITMEWIFEGVTLYAGMNRRLRCVQIRVSQSRRRYPLRVFVRSWLRSP